MPVETSSRGRRSWLLRGLMALDALVALASVYLVARYAGLPGVPEPSALLDAQVRVSHLFQAAALAIAWQLSFAVFGLYHSRRLSGALAEAGDVVKAVSLGVAAVLGLDRLLGFEQLPLPIAGAFWVVAVAACTASRLLLRVLQRRLRRHGRNLRHLVVVGTGPRALELATSLLSRPSLGYHLLGFVDEPGEAREDFRRTGRPLLAGFSDFPAFLATHVVDEVIICLPLRSLYQQAARLARLSQEQGVLVRVSSDLFDLDLATARSDELDGARVVTVSAGGITGWPALAKSLLDRGLAAAGLLLLSPLLAAVAIAVRLDSPGPALYVQERIGLNKRRFRLLKFRTMVVGADARRRELEATNETAGPAFKMRRDPRVTRVGRYLRKYSIDELPQLVNVLAGDMSLVGPRPLPVRDCEGFTTDWHRRRFSVRPGLSCLWQISGRSTIGFEDWMRLDMQYIDQWSLWLDAKIMARTVVSVLKGDGAW
jgi:exopolysaccharide biosynthesis polyprenyl glycosylphosphotransferase